MKYKILKIKGKVIALKKMFLVSKTKTKSVINFILEKKYGSSIVKINCSYFSNKTKMIEKIYHSKKENKRISIIGFFKIKKSNNKVYNNFIAKKIISSLK